MKEGQLFALLGSNGAGKSTTIKMILNLVTIKKEKAQLDVFAGTTLEVDGQWQVLLPTYEQFSGFFDALGTLGSYQQGMQDGSFAFSESGYDADMHTATIWHEAFHAWQAENWQESMEALTGQTDDENPVDIIVRDFIFIGRKISRIRIQDTICLSIPWRRILSLIILMRLRLYSLHRILESGRGF